jgi:glycosyltransferase involved in cell wall biosynthesis
MGTLPIIRNDTEWGSQKPRRIARIKTKDKLNDTAILITTFIRDAALFRCVKSIQKYYPRIAIFIADNGKPNAKKRQFCKDHKCTLVASPFDSGVGNSRNAVFSVLPKKYKYVVICEDDALFTDETKLENWIVVLEAEKKVGIVGGGLKKHGAKTLTDQHYEGWLYMKATTFHVEKIDVFDWKRAAGIRYALCDIVINIFMMKRELWDSQKWDSDMKTWPEHEDFFFGLKKKTDWKVAYTDTVSLIHKPILHDHKYAMYRSRVDGLQIFAKKWGIEYIWNSWHEDWGKPNPMRIGESIPKTVIPKTISEKKFDVAIGIKTFLREGNFFRTIQKIKENFPYLYKLYIADDGYISPKKQGLYEELESQGHEVTCLPFNVGISAGRNHIVKNVKENYIFIMDDDIGIDSPDAIKNMKKVLDSDENIGVVAGMLFHEISGKSFANDNYTYRGIDLSLDRGLLVREASDHPVKKVDGVKYRYADQVVNFFLAKREVFEDVQWDARIKVEWEHMDFFLSLKETPWKVAICLDAKATHLHDKERDLEYNQYRRSASFHYFSQKHNVSKVVNRWV